MSKLYINLNEYPIRTEDFIQFYAFVYEERARAYKLSYIGCIFQHLILNKKGLLSNSLLLYREGRDGF
jgi:hypothetical protein